MRAIDTLINKSWIALLPVNHDHRDFQKPRRKLASDKYAHRTPGTVSTPSNRSRRSTPHGKRTSLTVFTAIPYGKLVLHAPLEHRLNRMADAIQQAYAMKRASIVLTGEIAKASWLKHLLSRLTNLQVSLAHSSSEAGQWQENREHTPSVIVGTRSAIFSPLQSIGLIWVDGEEDAALKELQEPRYHAREVASWRAESERALVVLASAHPSLEAIFDSEAEIHHVPQDLLVSLRLNSLTSATSRLEPSSVIHSFWRCTVPYETVPRSYSFSIGKVMQDVDLPRLWLGPPVRFLYRSTYLLS